MDVPQPKQYLAVCSLDLYPFLFYCSFCCFVFCLYRPLVPSPFSRTRRSSKLEHKQQAASTWLFAPARMRTTDVETPRVIAGMASRRGYKEPTRGPRPLFGARQGEKGLQALPLPVLSSIFWPSQYARFKPSTEYKVTVCLVSRKHSVMVAVAIHNGTWRVATGKEQQRRGCGAWAYT